MIELTPEEELKLKDIAINYLEETLGLSPKPTPASANVIEGMREALIISDVEKARLEGIKWEQGAMHTPTWSNVGFLLELIDRALPKPTAHRGGE